MTQGGREQGGWEQPGRWHPGQSPPPPDPQYGYPQYGYPQHGYPPPQRQTDSTAIAALVLAIVSFYVFPVIPAIVALALCPSARRNIESSGGRLTGEGLVTAAKAISWVNIALWSLIVIAVVIIAIVAAALDDTNEFSLVLSVFR